MGMPSREELDKALKLLEKAEGSIGPPLNPTPAEAFRYKLQQSFVKYKQEKGLTGRQLARLLKADEAKISKLLRNRIKEFSTDKLMDWYTKINPDFKVELVA